MREGFKAAIQVLGRNPAFVLLSGDHGYGLFDEFRVQFPEQFINVGVAETNMVGLSAGLSRAGLRPLIYGLASFIPSRVYEFLKLQIGLDNLPVAVVGDGGGLVYSTLGHSHQALDDLALATALPNFSVFSPSGDSEVFEIMTSPERLSSPTYLRLGKSDQSLKLGFPSNLIEPHRVWTDSKPEAAILSHGAMTSKMARLAELGHFHADVWSFPIISPLEPKWIGALKDYKRVVVVEEHIENGGLASSIMRQPGGKSVTLSWVGASQTPHRGVGNYDWALTQHGLGNTELVERVREALNVT